jgi:hypothetical protein
MRPIPSGKITAWFLAPMFDWTLLPFFVPLYGDYQSEQHDNAERENKPFINVLSCAIAADKANCFDTRMIANSIHCWNCSMHDIDDTWRKPRSLTKFRNDHRRSRVTLRGFQDKCVPGNGSQRDRPEWDHPVNIRRKSTTSPVDERTYAGKLNGEMLGRSVSVNATVK